SEFDRTRLNHLTRRLLARGRDDGDLELARVIEQPFRHMLLEPARPPAPARPAQQYACDVARLREREDLFDDVGLGMQRDRLPTKALGHDRPAAAWRACGGGHCARGTR